MRILYLTPTLPYPPTTGHLRDLNFVRRLGARHEVTLVSLADRQPTREQMKVLGQHARLHVVPLEEADGALPRRALDWGRYLLSGRLYKPWQRSLRAHVEGLLRGERFDVLHASTYSLYPSLIGLARPPLVFDLCDAMSLRLAMSARYASLPARVARTAQATRMHYWERSVVAGADRVVVASARDRDAVGGGERVVVVPNGVDCDHYRRRGDGRHPSRLVFVGAMDYPPNVDAAIYFAARVLPLIRRRRPDAEFWVVGRDPTPAVWDLAWRPGVYVTGRVPDVRPHLEQAAVFVAPLRFASGIQNKVLEAMAMEAPVVATSEASAGLEAVRDRHLLVGDGTEGFARAVVDCLEDEGLRARLAAAARAFVVERHDWDECTSRLQAVYADAQPPSRRAGDVPTTGGEAVE